MQMKVGKYSEIGADAQRIRDVVFVDEQGVDIALERDEYDQLATHVVVYDDEFKPVATARIVQMDGIYYIGRVATLKHSRGKGYGKTATKALIDWAAQNGISEIVIHAQKHAEEFYAKLGFIPYGEVYVEAGIEHISMRKELP